MYSTQNKWTNDVNNDIDAFIHESRDSISVLVKHMYN